MTDRDTFAAAALTGFASQLRYGSVFNLTLTAKQCYELADAMLRERERTNHDAAPAARASGESVVPQPTPRGDSDRTDKAAPRPSEGTGDTPKPISGCVSDRSKPINGPDPDSRVWETPVHTPATHATPAQGSVQRECTEPVAWAVCNPVGVHYRSFGYHHEALECCLQKIRETGDRFYIRALHAAPPQGAVVRLPPLDPNGAPGWNAAIGAVREALADAGVDWDTE